MTPAERGEYLGKIVRETWVERQKIKLLGMTLTKAMEKSKEKELNLRWEQLSLFERETDKLIAERVCGALAELIKSDPEGFLKIFMEEFERILNKPENAQYSKKLQELLLYDLRR